CCFVPWSIERLRTVRTEVIQNREPDCPSGTAPALLRPERARTKPPHWQKSFINPGKVCRAQICRNCDCLEPQRSIMNSSPPVMSVTNATAGFKPSYSAEI